jgi:hypothetical protein
MPEAISAVVLVGYAALHTIAQSSSAVSQEARSVRQAAHQVRASVERSEALFRDKAMALSDLHQMAAQCQKEGDQLDPVAVRLTEDFIRTLPGDIPLPEFAPEPGGRISLDWIQSRNRFLSLSVGPRFRVAYAWIDGEERGHGVAHFNGSQVSQRILDAIRLIMTNGDATFRFV